MDLFYFLPESFLVFSLLVLILYGVVYSTSKVHYYPVVIRSHIWLSVYTFIICLLLLGEAPTEESYIFFSSLRVDPYSTSLKSLLLISLILTSLISFDFVKKEKINSFEYVSLLLLSVLGMLLLVSSNNLLMLFLSLELQALSFYILTSFQRTNEKSIEAGLKYFIFGAFSTGILLFGSSLLYGTTGLFYLEDFPVLLSSFQRGEHIPVNLFMVAVLFLLVGFLFKLYAVPFHVWVPDIYEGSPTHITALFATAPVIAIFGVFARIMNVTFYEILPYWNTVLLTSSLLSMLLGCFAAIYQKKVKRLLAYSSIGHVGFFLLGVTVGTPEGIQASFFYIIGYVLMTLGFFSGLLCLRKKETGHLVENIKDLHLLYKVNPLVALTLALFLFSMAGIPPLLGFFSKLYIFLNASENSLYIFLAVGVVTSAISAFYYLNCIKIMYFESTRYWDLFDSIDKTRAFSLSVCTFFVSFFFIYPSFLVSISNKIAITLIY